MLEKKRAIDDSKLLEICRGETDDDVDETYQIVVSTSEGKNKAFNTNKNFQS
jgi:hypothetical protein